MLPEIVMSFRLTSAERRYPLAREGPCPREFHFIDIQFELERQIGGCALESERRQLVRRNGNQLPQSSTEIGL